MSLVLEPLHDSEGNIPPDLFLDDNAASLSLGSATTAFETGLYLRDVFLGERRCIVCGRSSSKVLKDCYISPEENTDKWKELRVGGWLPKRAKEDPKHEPRNGFVACSACRDGFSKQDFYIRYLPNVKKYVFVNVSGHRDWRQYHGKAVGLDPDDTASVYPSVLYAHEIFARAHYLITKPQDGIPSNPPFQDWMIEEGVVNPDSNSTSWFVRQRKEPDSKDDGPPAANTRKRKRQTEGGTPRGGVGSGGGGGGGRSDHRGSSARRGTGGAPGRTGRGREGTGCRGGGTVAGTRSRERGGAKAREKSGNKDESQEIEGPFIVLTADPETEAEILAASKELPCYKSWLVEGLTWEGTAAENTEKYLRAIREEI